MKPHHLAQILLRVVAIFIVWRALEFGISQYIGFQYQMKIYTPATDEESKELFRSVHTIILISSMIPVILSAILWWLSPTLSRLITNSSILDDQQDQAIVSGSTILQASGFIFIALAASTLPQIIYSLSADRLRDPTVTVMTSRVFPDVMQFMGKVVVGGIILLIVKKKTLQ